MALLDYFRGTLKTTMKHLFALAILLSSFAAFSQDWVHSGSTWTYSWSEMGGMGYNIYHYTGETFLNGHTCHQLTSTTYAASYIGPNYSFRYDTINNSPIFTYSQSDTVFFFDQRDNTWKGIYFFNVHGGDSITIPNIGLTTAQGAVVHAAVDTVGLLTTDTMPLRFYTFHLTDSCNMGWYRGGTIVERLGILDNNIIPEWFCATDGTGYGFCSYKDDSFALYKPYAHCDELPTGIHDAEPNEVINIHPNPASDLVLIDYPYSTEATLTVTAADGRIALAEKYTKTMSVASLPTGIYIVTVSDGDHTSRSKLTVCH